MAYNYTLEDLLAIMHSHAPAQVNTVSLNRRRVEHGLGSVGLKIHSLDSGPQFDCVINALGGQEKVLEENHYRREGTSICWVLPPVGSARIAEHLLEAIELTTRSKLFNNPRIQIQVCSPKRLEAERAALLSIGFYLGSDTLRRFGLSDLGTTFTTNDTYPRGRRLVLHDADGTFDVEFDWWDVNNGERVVRSKIPAPHNRTDLLAATSKLDIHNINLLATLLAHSQYGGYWRRLGARFEKEMRAMLDAHMLSGLLQAPWIRTKNRQTMGDDEFFAALQELMTYALGEASRVKKRGRFPWQTSLVAITRANPEILHEMQRLLRKYRSLLVDESNKLDGGKRT